MKRMLAASAALCMLLCGCGDYREIDRRDIVSTVAADRTPEGYKLLLEIADVSSGAENSPGARWLSLEGASLTEAVEGGVAGTGRQAYLGHMQLVVVGDETARQGLDDLLGYLQRTPDVHMTLALAVAEGRAETLLAGQQESEAAAFDLSRAAIGAAQEGQAPSMPLYRFIADRQEEGIEGILPRISQENGEIRIEGAALFRGDKLAGKLDPDLTQMLLMARGMYDSGVVTVGEGEKAVAYIVRRCRARQEVEQSGGSIRACCTISLELELSQGGHGESLDEDRKKYYESMAQAEIERRFAALRALLQSEYGVDCLGIGRHIHRFHPSLWEQVGEDWDRQFMLCDISAQVDVKLVGSGRSLR